MQINAKAIVAWSCHQCLNTSKVAFCQPHRSIAIGRRQKNYYDSLGVSPTASQGEIKAAYYKLSKVYHPDRNKGCQDAADRFRRITEAYETVGNVQKRRIYDKGGMFETQVDIKETEEQAAVSKFYKSRGMTYTGKTPIYDFDEWSREHYGRTFARREKAKARHFTNVSRESNIKDHNQSLFFMLLVSGSVFLLSVFGMRTHEDVDRVSQKRKQEK